MVVSAQSRDLMAMAQKVDSASPRWGSFISEKTLNDDLTRIHLAENTAIIALPAQIRQLGAKIQELQLIGTTFGIENLQENFLTRDAAKVSYNSFNFARRTVAVAAGAKALYEPECRRAQSARTALASSKASLPGGLVTRLEAAALEADGGEDEDHAAASPGVAGGGKRALGHTVGSSSAPRDAVQSKRPRAG